jgi:DNA-binding beta-propeller fold protein YncE
LRPDPVYFPPPPATPHAVHLKSFNSLADLVPPKVSWVDIIRGGAVSPHVETPTGIAFAGDSLYVCDTGNGTVHCWNLATGEARRLGAHGDVQLTTPVDVAVGMAGEVYVADSGRGEVVAFDRSGACTRQFQPEGREGYRPVAVAVHDSRIYTADLASHQVDVFSTAHATAVGAFGQVGSESGTFYYPVGLASDAAGNVLVSDMMNARVQVFGSGHVHVRSIGQPGDRYGDLGKPKGVAVGPDGTIFIADADFARVHLFNSQGQLLMLLGQEGSGPGGTPMPSGLATATTLPERLRAMVPDDFRADYFLFVTNTTGPKRISLYAIGVGR